MSVTVYQGIHDILAQAQATATAAATATIAPTPTVTATPNQPVQANGSATLAANNCFDLDNGTTVLAGSSEADVCWQVSDPNRFLTPQNTAQIALMNAGTQPGFADCRDAALRTDPINGSTSSNEIPSGTYLCFRTSDGRVASMRIDMYGTNLQIDYITWKS
jgi:hypothetical protein